MTSGRGFRCLSAALCAALALGCYAERGPSTPAERAQAVAAVRQLEREPFDASAPATRRWLREWIVSIPDIHFGHCDDLLAHGLPADYPFRDEVVAQVLFSGAGFTLEHPNEARDISAVYTAGVEGALRFYEALRSTRADAGVTFLDDLVASRERGALADHVRTLAAEHCPRRRGDLLPAAVGALAGFLLGAVVARRFGPRRAASAAEVIARRRRATVLRRIVFAAAAYYAISLVTLHVFEPEFDPRYRFMSEYVMGAYGWLMTTTFFVLGLAIFAAALALRELGRSSRGAQLGFGILVVGALFVCLAGVFKSGVPHLIASVVALPGVTMAALLLSWSFRCFAGWRMIHGLASGIAIAMLALLLPTLVHVGMPGLQQRIFVILLLTWLCLVARKSERASGSALDPGS